MVSNDPQLCVAICTRGRSTPLATAVGSLLADPDESVQVIVVDQNDDDRAADVLAPFLDDPRLLHLRIDTIGAGRARNVALSHATSEVICFTDDDCSAPPGWARELTAVLTSDPDLALAYCEVTEPEHDDDKGYTPMHHVPSRVLHTSWDLGARFDRLGIGAGMAARRRDLEAIGGFDPLMGPGGQFPSADDREIAIRLLLVGRHVVHTPHPVTLHHGFRPDGIDARALTKRDYLALGAMHAKFLKTHPLRALLHTVVFVVVSAAGAVTTSVQLRRPAGLGKLRWGVVGLVRGLRTKIDRTTINYIDAPTAQTD